MTKKKIHGQVFTPKHIVDQMLDSIGYVSSNLEILTKKIMEPSFGQGIFLFEIIERLVESGRIHGMNESEISGMLQENVWGIELDEALYEQVIEDLNRLLEDRGIPLIESWNLYSGNTLSFKDDFVGSFDFVVGNPPYVRIHNIPESDRALIKGFEFATGTTDLYIVFFEMGINFLNETGKLAYITPNSFMKNTSQKSFRKFLIDNQLLSKLSDYRSSKIFSDADTYATITYLSKNRDTKKVAIYNLIDKNGEYSTELSYAELLKNSGEPWNFADPTGLIEKQAKLGRSLDELAHVQYGLATLRDKIYIDQAPIDQEDGTTLFHGQLVETKLLRPVVKASTFKGGDVKSKIIFPYARNEHGGFNVISEEEMRDSYPLTYAYFVLNETELRARSMDKNYTAWFQYGRSQGISLAGEPKLIFSHVIHPDKKIQTFKLPAGTLVYSGFFLISKNGIELDAISKTVETPNFLDYAQVVGKDMAGGFLSITPKHVKSFRVT